mgnify:CR=1 FL=1
MEKTVLLIGLGQFGYHMAVKMKELKSQVLGIDIDEERVNNCLPYLTSAKIADSTDEAFLRTLGVRNFDVDTTALLRAAGAKLVVARASSEFHAKFFLRNGADEVIYPERDMAIHGAVKYASNHVRDFIQLSDEYSIYETSVPPQWVGKSILDLEVRKKYHLNILAIKREEQIDPEVNPNYQFTGQETVFLMGSRENMRPFL